MTTRRGRPRAFLRQSRRKTAWRDFNLDNGTLAAADGSVTPVQLTVADDLNQGRI